MVTFKKNTFRSIFTITCNICWSYGFCGRCSRTSMSAGTWEVCRVGKWKVLFSPGICKNGLLQLRCLPKYHSLFSQCYWDLKAKTTPFLSHRPYDYTIDLFSFHCTFERKVMFFVGPIVKDTRGVLWLCPPGQDVYHLWGKKRWLPPPLYQVPSFKKYHSFPPCVWSVIWGKKKCIRN